MGGGPSLPSCVAELRAFDGDIWGINDVAVWLATRGIAATFFTCDPSPPDMFDTEGLSRALLASLCHPDLRARFSEVDLFDMAETTPDGITGGPSTATRAAHLALRMGYCDVTWYGCEGSFAVDVQHVYQRERELSQVVIRCGDKEYVTNLQLMVQSECLAGIIEMAPGIFKERSGGLLRSMIEHNDTWEVVAVSEALKAQLERSGGRGYDTRYEVA